MTEPREPLRRSHPVFFWGMVSLAALLLTAAVAVAVRIPAYVSQATELDRRMTEAERETRDRVLESRTRRAELAIALLRRELRLKSLDENDVHLAIDTEDSVLLLRHGPAILRRARLRIGPDSTVRAPDGRSWRFVRALGERRVEAKEVSPEYVVPEWVYLSRGEPVPPEPERRVAGGLGRYVLRLDDGTEIHSEPQAGPLRDAVIPASFTVPEESDLRAIFDAVPIDTPVFIY